MSASRLLSLTGLLACAGCVMVETPDVRVGVVGSSSAGRVAEPEPADRPARLMQSVADQHDKLTRKLHKSDWGDLHEEAGQWSDQVRELRAHADVSADPDRFKRCCDEFLTLIQTLRQAARHKDPQGCTQVLDTCDRLVGELSGMLAPGGSAHRPAAEPPSSARPATPPRVP